MHAHRYLPCKRGTPAPGVFRVGSVRRCICGWAGADLVSRAAAARVRTGRWGGFSLSFMSKSPQSSSAEESARGCSARCGWQLPSPSPKCCCCTGPGPARRVVLLDRPGVSLFAGPQSSKACPMTVSSVTANPSIILPTPFMASSPLSRKVVESNLNSGLPDALRAAWRPDSSVEMSLSALFTS